MSSDAKDAAIATAHGADRQSSSSTSAAAPTSAASTSTAPTSASVAGHEPRPAVTDDRPDSSEPLLPAPATDEDRSSEERMRPTTAEDSENATGAEKVVTNGETSTVAPPDVTTTVSETAETSADDLRARSQNGTRKRKEPEMTPSVTTGAEHQKSKDENDEEKERSNEREGSVKRARAPLSSPSSSDASAAPAASSAGAAGAPSSEKTNVKEEEATGKARLSIHHDAPTTEIPMAQPVPDDFVYHCRQRVRDLMGMRVVGFPGAQPVSFEQRHLSNLEIEDYFVSEKADGARYVMFCTTDPTGMPATLLIDRKNEYKFVPNIYFPFRHDPNQCHVDTILDGELVVDFSPSAGKRFRFLLFDCMVMDGQSIAHKPLSSRLGYVREQILVPFWKMVNQRGQVFKDALPFSVEMKDVELAYGLKKVFQYIEKLRHGNDGLLFTAVHEPYKIGSCDTMLKWKPPELNTIDFRLRQQVTHAKASASGTLESADSLPLFDMLLGNTPSPQHPGKEIKYAVFTPESKAFLDTEPDGKIAECKWDKDAKQWRWLRYREDKDTPNHMHIIPSLWNSIENGVDKAQLLDEKYLRKIELAWKARKHAATQQQHQTSF